MRRGREFYDKNYELAVTMHEQGIPVKDIAAKLGISYSAVYHWVKGLRKPEAGNVTVFVDYMKAKGPLPAGEIKQKFPKHNELFLISGKRGLPVKRFLLSKRLGEYGTWYFLAGQEHLLKERIKNMFDIIRKLAEKE